tara:strand:+ start:36814 stop:37458 length:645 start_codon:yes stop_codon:yes gene_type:complete
VGTTISVTTQTNKCWAVGQYIILTLSSDSSNYLVACVTFYNPNSTGLSFEVKEKSGTQAANDWNINVTGVPGPSGPVGSVGSTGNAGATGPTGPVAPVASRGASDAEIDLNGGTVTLDCGATEIFKCNLVSSSNIKLSNVSGGQAIYVLVRYDNTSMDDVIFDDPSDGVIYWEWDTIPSPPSSVTPSKLYQFTKITHHSTASVYLGKDLGEFNV